MPDLVALLVWVVALAFRPALADLKVGATLKMRHHPDLIEIIDNAVVEK
jgi:hypothetical protein